MINEHFGVFLGLRKPTPEEIHEEWDARMRQEYYDPIERFPERIDLLLNAINRVCHTFPIFSSNISPFLVALQKSNRKTILK